MISLTSLAHLMKVSKHVKNQNKIIWELIKIITKELKIYSKLLI